ncbi:MAG: hypothetical protein WA740_05030 [Candidatus Binataceae bacterium]
MKPGKNDKRRSIAPPGLEGVALESAAVESLLSDECYERKTIDGAALSAADARGVVFDTCIIRRTALDGSKLARLRIVDVRVEKTRGSEHGRPGVPRLWLGMTIGGSAEGTILIYQANIRHFDRREKSRGVHTPSHVHVR